MKDTIPCLFGSVNLYFVQNLSMMFSNHKNRCAKYTFFIICDGRTILASNNDIFSINPITQSYYKQLLTFTRPLF